MGVFPDLNVVQGASSLGSSAEIIAVYWPASAGANAEAWAYSAAGAYVETTSTAVMPFTPATGQTTHGEATPDPGEMIAGRSVLIPNSTGYSLAILSDSGSTLYLWNVFSGVVSTVSISVSVAFDQVLMVPAGQAVRLAYLDESESRLDTFLVDSKGNVTASGSTLADSRFDEIGLAGADTVGVYLLTGDGDDGTGSGGVPIRTLERVAWGGTKTPIVASKEVQVLPTLGLGGGLKFLACYPTGSQLSGVVSWCVLADGRSENHQITADNGSGQGFALRVISDNFGNRANDSGETGQHMSASSSGLAIFRYGTQPVVGQQYNLTLNPKFPSAGTLSGSPATVIGNRPSDNARPHQAHLASYSASFSYS